MALGRKEVGREREEREGRAGEREREGGREREGDSRREGEKEVGWESGKEREKEAWRVHTVKKGVELRREKTERRVFTFKL